MQIVLLFTQVVVALGLLNVWLLRAKRSTPYRGGGSVTLKSEFEAYGLPSFAFYVVGFLKISAAIALLVGIQVQAITGPAATLVALLMVGALLMHVKVKDAWVKSLPAFLMLLMSLMLIVTSSFP